MKLSDYTKGESKYLRADDLEPNQKVPLTINEIVVDVVEDPKTNKKKDKAIAYFDGWPRQLSEISGKGLVLNTTNGEVLTTAYGDSIEDQKRQKVTLYRSTTPFGRKVVPCLRLDAPGDFSEPVGIAGVTESPKDEIPF